MRESRTDNAFILEKKSKNVLGSKKKSAFVHAICTCCERINLKRQPYGTRYMQ